MKSILFVLCFFCIATFASGSESHVCTITAKDQVTTWEGKGDTIGLAYDRAISDCVNDRNSAAQEMARKACETLNILCI